MAWIETFNVLLKTFFLLPCLTRQKRQYVSPFWCHNCRCLCHSNAFQVNDGTHYWLPCFFKHFGGLEPIGQKVFQSGVPEWSNSRKYQSVHWTKKICHIWLKDGPVEGAAIVTHISQFDSPCFRQTCHTSNQLLIDEHAQGPFKK